MRKATLPSNPAPLWRRWQFISGTQASCITQAQQQLAGVEPVLWISTAPQVADAVPANKAHTLLGQEFQAIVFDAFGGLDVNALAAVVGTLRGGGVLLLLTPPWDSWPTFPDPAAQRFLPWPYQAANIHSRFIQRFIGLPPSPPFPRKGGREKREAYSLAPAPLAGEGVGEGGKNTTQQAAIQRIIQANSVLVLSADRGRGKSAALGLVASELVATGQQVLVTAPSKATVRCLFQHATHAPTFCAPDELLQTLPAADILLVDEAAAIPLPLLTQMVQHYPRSVFATTLHGYEGSGRGFVLRFQASLHTLAPDWQAIRLEQPMRWAANDPLEKWLNRLCLLDSELEPLKQAVTAHDTTQWQYQQLSQDDLLSDETLLRSVFGLLVTAHYQTRPSDLRQLLDAPNVSIHIVRQRATQQLLAVALLSREGGLDAALTAAIHAGQRRPHGHLIPQTLTFHAGLAGAAELVCERVMRIAVHPEAQGLGIGSYCLKQLIAYAQPHADYLGVSYAATPGTQAFWWQAGMQTARQGFRRDTASGARSIVQIRALSAAGQRLCERLIVQPEQ